MAYVVSLKQFDGPLDLLLTLISRAKVDIRDIFVSEITEQYLASMEGLDELDMDAASEFLQMAATLLEIKSRALLPPDKSQDPEEESPEEALIRQLTEYKTFKELSGEMKSLEEEARALITKLPEEYPVPPPLFELTGLTLDGLARAFARVLKRVQDRQETGEPARREIQRDRFTVQSCMFRIQRRVKKGETSFAELFEDAPGRDEVITVFLALLELLRLNRITVRQRNVYGEIRLKAAE
ncbi:MAG: segregation/condensation protein A [Clostridia bacterium]|nr:segregation/condensation protein A [Clostridia bacterium]